MGKNWKQCPFLGEIMQKRVYVYECVCVFVCVVVVVMEAFKE